MDERVVSLFRCEFASCFFRLPSQTTFLLRRLRLVDVARYQVFWNPASIALDHVSCAQAFRCDDVGQRLLAERVAALQQGDVGASSWVVFDSDDVLRTRLCSHEIDDADTSFMTSADVSDGDLAQRVSATFLPFGQGQRANGTPLVEMRRDGTAEMAQAGSYGFVGLDAFGFDVERGEDGLNFWSRIFGIGRECCVDPSG